MLVDVNKLSLAELARLDMFLTFCSSESTLIPQLETLSLDEHGFRVWMLANNGGQDFWLRERE